MFVLLLWYTVVLIHHIFEADYKSCSDVKTKTTKNKNDDNF